VARVARVRERLHRWTLALKTLGPAEVGSFLVRRLRETLRLTRGQYELKTRNAKFPLFCRSQSSDLSVFSQVFVHREYRCLDDLTNVGVVIDCGANVGYSSAYFLSKFPGSTVIAIEPDPGNFGALEKNLAPYGDRVRALRSGVWPYTTGLVMSEAAFRDGREWARQVRPALPGEVAQMEAVDLRSVIDGCDGKRISILKVDIEGAEYEIFKSPGWRGWIDRVDRLVIEVHSEDAYRVTMAALEEAGFEISRSDELIVGRRPTTDEGPESPRRRFVSSIQTGSHLRVKTSGAPAER
jgi:FkbM family methyltransferase